MVYFLPVWKLRNDLDSTKKFRQRSHLFLSHLKQPLFGWIVCPSSAVLKRDGANNSFRTKNLKELLSSYTQDKRQSTGIYISLTPTYSIPRMLTAIHHCKYIEFLRIREDCLVVGMLKITYAWVSSLIVRRSSLLAASHFLPWDTLSPLREWIAESGYWISQLYTFYKGKNSICDFFSPSLFTIKYMYCWLCRGDTCTGQKAVTMYA